MGSVLEFSAKSDSSMPPAMPDMVDDSATFTSWVRQNVIPAYEAYKDNPERIYTTEDVRAHLAKEIAKRR